MTIRRSLVRLALVVVCAAYAFSCGAASDKPASETTELAKAKKRKKKKRKKNKNPRRKRAVAVADDEDDEDDDEDGVTPPRPMTKRELDKERQRNRERARARAQLRDDRPSKKRSRRNVAEDTDEPEPEPDAESIVIDDEEIEEEAPRKRPRAPAAKKAKPVAAKPAAKKAKPVADEDEDEDEEDEDDEDEDDDAPRKRTPPPKPTVRKRPPPKPVARKPAPPKPAVRKPVPKKAVDLEEEEDEDEDEEEEEEDEAPPPKRKPAAVAKASKPKPAKPVDDDEAVLDMSDEELDMSDPDDDDETPPDRVAAISVPGVEDEDPLAQDTLEEEAPPQAASRLMNERPLTLAKGAYEAHGGLRVATLPSTMPGVTPSTTTTQLLLGGSYGVSDKVEIGGDYAAGLDPGSIKGPLTLRAAYSARTGKQLDVGLATGLAFSFDELTDPATMMTTTTTFASLQLGVWARYRATPKVSIFTGNPALPTNPASVSKLALPLPPFVYQLAIGLNNAGPIALELPVGVGFQATPKIYGVASINFAHVRLANTQTGLLFADFIPLVIGGFYTLPTLDIGLVLSDDLKQGSDYLRLDAVLRYAIR